MRRRVTIGIILTVLLLALSALACWATSRALDLAFFGMVEAPSGTIVGDTMNQAEHYFTSQMSRHRSYVVMRCRDLGASAFLSPLVDEFFGAFLNATSGSFFATSITRIESQFTPNYPLEGLGTLVGGPNLSTTIFVLDNNLSSRDQRRVHDWLRAFVSSYLAGSYEMARQFDVQVTGLEMMQEALRGPLLKHLWIMAGVAVSLVAIGAPCCTFYTQNSITASSKHQQLEAAPDARYVYSAARTLLGGAALIGGGACMVSAMSLASMWFIAAFVDVSLYAPMLVIVVTGPLTTLFLVVAVHNVVLSGLATHSTAPAAADGDLSSEPHDEPSSLSHDCKQCRSVLFEALAPLQTQVYVTLFLSLSAMWLTYVQILSTCGAVAILATVVSVATFNLLVPVLAALVFSRSYAHRLPSTHRASLVPWAKFLAPCNEPHIHRRWFRPVTVLRLVSLTVIGGLASWMCIVAQRNVAFFPQVPPGAPCVVAGRSMLDALGSHAIAPYSLVFQAPVTGTVLVDSTFFDAANEVLYKAASELQVQAVDISSVTSYLGKNYSTLDALLALVMDPQFQYLWAATVDPSDTIFRGEIRPSLNAFGDRHAVAAEERLDEVINAARGSLPVFGFLGWYGGNAAAWAAGSVAVPASVVWTATAVGLVTLFNLFVWNRRGKFDPPESRVNEIIGETDARLSMEASRTKMLGWSIARSLIMCAGHSFGVSLCAVLETGVAFAVAIWLFQYGWTVQRVVPSLDGIDGITWFVFPLLIPVAITLSFAHECVLWIAANDAHASRPSQPTLSSFLISRGGSRDDEKDEEATFAPCTTLVVSCNLLCWLIGFATLVPSSTIVISEIGVVLSGVTVAHFLVGPTLRWTLLSLLDWTRVRF